VVCYGGDEFLVILADAPLEGAKVVASRVEKAVEDWNREGHLEGFNLVLCVGLAQWSPDQTLDQVLTAADQEMYAAKAIRKGASR